MKNIGDTLHSKLNVSNLNDTYILSDRSWAKCVDSLWYAVTDALKFNIRDWIMPFYD